MIASQHRRGFTLVELIVALAITTLVLIGARAILEQLADSADRTTRAAIDADRIANTDRIARTLFEHATAADDAHPFLGTPQSVHFWSWCDTPAGWNEPCTVTATILSDSSHLRVNILTSTGDTLYIRNPLSIAEFRYLDDASNGGHWTIAWPAGVTTPLAVGVVTSHDTLVFRIGDRR